MVGFHAWSLSSLSHMLDRQMRIESIVRSAKAFKIAGHLVDMYADC